MDKWLLIEIVVTLAATGTLMWFVRRRPELGAYGNLVASLAGLGLLYLLYALGLTSAGYILLALVGLIGAAYLLSMVLE
jgi:hypothetical protein